MNRTRAALLALAVAVSAASLPVWADRGGDRFHGDRGWHGDFRGDRGDDHGDDHFGVGLGLLFGSALLWSALQPSSTYYPAQPVYSYSPPAYYPAPAVVTQYVQTPTAWLPPPPASAAPDSQVSDGQWWYFCGKPKGYYPYVKRCQVGWEKVSPAPSGQ